MRREVQIITVLPVHAHKVHALKLQAAGHLHRHHVPLAVHETHERVAHSHAYVAVDATAGLQLLNAAVDDFFALLDVPGRRGGVG
jgi:hypothetical protein